MKYFLILCFVSMSSYGVVERDYITEMDDSSYREQNPRLYRGEGEHQCQSNQSIGHTCKNLGVNFTDCNNAFYKLKLDDCCSSSEYGGTSIGFKLTKCSNFN